MLIRLGRRIFPLVIIAMLGPHGAGAVGLPGFDFDKADRLTEERRRQYDVVFFNEIETWNVNSNRYGADSQVKRRAEFEDMAKDGYLPAYAALRLAGIWPAERRHDPEAFALLLNQADRGDAAAMCAVLAIPKKAELWGARDRRAESRRFMIQSAARGHGGCMAYYGGALLLGNIPEIAEDRKAAMPMLLKAAKQGYYVAAKRLFSLRYSAALKGEFDFSNEKELARAVCWGRLAQQHTNWAGFETFLELVRDYARKSGRPDLIEVSHRYDPKRVPISEKVVDPEHCIRLEKGA